MSQPYPLFCGMASCRGVWCRFFGWGLSIVDGRWLRETFSERYGYVKVFRIGRFRVQGLRP